MRSGPFRFQAGEYVIKYLPDDIALFRKEELLLLEEVPVLQRLLHREGANVIARVQPDLTLAERTYLTRCLDSVVMMARGSEAFAPPSISAYQERDWC